MTSLGGQDAGPRGIEQAIEAVLEPDHLDSGVERGFDDGADDGIQSGRIATAGQDTNASDVGHARTIASAYFADRT